MANLKIGVVIGRFQIPELHAGHHRLFAHVKENNDQIVVLLGISPVDGYTAENPLTFNQRASIVRACLPATWEPVILPLVDMRTNEEWSAQIDALLKGAYSSDAVRLYGGRDSFVDAYRGTLNVEHFTACPPVPEAGTVNRAAIKEANSSDFYRGQIFALQRQFPKAYPTVDIAVLKEHQTLLIQRADSGRWCFPGGFVDPTDVSLEMAAARELHEEVGISTSSGVADFVYRGSFRINDFRYRGSRDKIVTAFFTAPFFAGSITPNYGEVQDYKWIEPIAAKDLISDTHRPLLDALLKLDKFQPKSPNCTINHKGPCNLACGEP